MAFREVETFFSPQEENKKEVKIITERNKYLFITRAYHKKLKKSPLKNIDIVKYQNFL